MKKILNILVLLILFTGCNKQLSNEKYLSSIQDLKRSIITEQEDLPCSIHFNLAKKNEANLEYTFALDNPKISMYDISIVIVHNQINNDEFPTIGYFDEKQNLVPNVINEKSKYFKKITLSGLLDYDGQIKDFNGEFKAKIVYKDINQDEHIYYYNKHYSTK